MDTLPSSVSGCGGGSCAEPCGQSIIERDLHKGRYNGDFTRKGAEPQGAKGSELARALLRDIAREIEELHREKKRAGRGQGDEDKGEDGGGARMRMRMRIRGGGGGG